MLKTWKKVLLTLVIVMMIIAPISNVYSTAIDDLQNKVDDLDKQQADIVKKFTAIQKDIKIYKADSEGLDKNIEKYQIDVDALSEKSVIVNAEVARLESELQDASNGYTATKDLLDTRLRVLYENGFVNIWEILITSHSVTEFLSKYNVVISLFEYDKKILDAMQNQKEFIANKKQDTDLRKLQIDQIQYDVQKSKQALEDAKAAKIAKIAQLKSAEVELNNLKIKLQKEEEVAQKQLDIELAKIKYSTGSFNGIFAWPVPAYNGNKYISAKFGYSAEYFGGKLYHSGIDIASYGNIKGATIVAAESGKVIITGWANPNNHNASYGYYVVIDHGKSKKDGANYRTIYGHTSKIVVSVGQIVSRGQKIAEVGTTGFSTGYHLHFEIKKNNVAIDPYPYIT